MNNIKYISPEFGSIRRNRKNGMESQVKKRNAAIQFLSTQKKVVFRGGNAHVSRFGRAETGSWHF